MLRRQRALLAQLPQSTKNDVTAFGAAVQEMYDAPKLYAAQGVDEITTFLKISNPNTRNPDHEFVVLENMVASMRTAAKFVVYHYHQANTGQPAITRLDAALNATPGARDKLDEISAAALRLSDGDTDRYAFAVVDALGEMTSQLRPS